MAGKVLETGSKFWWVFVPRTPSVHGLLPVSVIQAYYDLKVQKKTVSKHSLSFFLRDLVC